MASTHLKYALSALILLPLFCYTNATSVLQKRGLVVATDLPGNWVSKGCQTEATNGRALTGSSYVDNNAMTEESCIAYCSHGGYFYAGVEYSQECYCGNALQSGSVAAAAGDCGMACTGNSTEQCGGPNRLNLFADGTAPPSPPTTDPGPPGWSFIGCYADNVNGGRTLTYGAGTPGGNGAMTVALCTEACGAAHYMYAGVEYAGECYCGNAFANGGGPASDGLAGCDMTCNGNSSEFCGGPNRLDVYNSTGGPPVTSTRSVPPSTTGTGPAGTGSGSATDLPAGWTYRGCFIDNANGGRILAQGEPDNSALTIENCISACQQAGNYTIAGMEYSTQCFCGDAIIEGGTLAPEDTDCNMACGGASTEECGGPNRMSIYAIGTLATLAPPATQTAGLPGSWQYQGCISEGNGVRTFPYQIILPNSNSAENCLTQCSAFGFGAGGLEYGEECYCGDAVDIALNGATTEPESDCNTVCSGNASYICGGGNRLSYYEWTGTPLNSWDFPTGNAAGAYEFLIGGVVVPLITSPSVNGKVTFLEKWGTGPPNSTGAYELDLAQLNNFTGAWRPMHLKTDVFCSAGITLPDKVGRQLDVGGWSGDSTYGLRLYWPDGSPGVWGTNDWQENHAEVALQAGRWYPSAMILSNGSVLVVGGESGSNGPPVPSLEVLPRPPGGGLVTCEYLAETDPFSLYPFLIVLPSGGIFIGYYNQARVLDPATFQTTKLLPGMPGSVNNPLSGRTYPLEGAAMILPQYAPYTDLVTILICGGSNPGPAIAVDNCISIQPDAANPEWVLERMPSKRVMPCITALPDGTYLILNGAHQGVAGFGLATDPNLNAVLYNPTKPVNARFSVLANTTVARLYHSEAVLLDDGRVLVSGSDPEDGVHPQEYRVEVFVPSYLLSGLEQPTYTIANIDWAYGGTYQINVQLFQGTTGGMRVSLMGAVASTHGNSMGQRTIFPAVSCAGNTCTITAPPNAQVCPPGWFQLFVLDGPTPSVAQWVRIGGDPSEVGNWPNFPDFSTPGLGPVGIIGA